MKGCLVIIALGVCLFIPGAWVVALIAIFVMMIVKIFK